MNTIDDFSGKYHFLSNFYMSVVKFEGISFPSVEHAYQGAKTHDMVIRKRVAQIKTAGGAKRAGNQIELREDWEDVKVSIMSSLVHDKFFSDNTLGCKLLNTANAELIEGNNWGDTFWGKVDGIGDNMLGRILMGVREELYEKLFE